MKCGIDVAVVHEAGGAITASGKTVAVGCFLGSYEAKSGGYEDVAAAPLGDRPINGRRRAIAASATPMRWSM